MCCLKSGHGRLGVTVAWWVTSNVRCRGITAAWLGVGHLGVWGVTVAWSMVGLSWASEMGFT